MANNPYFSSDAYFSEDTRHRSHTSSYTSSNYTSSSNYLAPNIPARTNLLLENAEHQGNKLSKSGETFRFSDPYAQKPASGAMFSTGNEKLKSWTPTANPGMDMMKRSFCPGPALNVPSASVRNRKISFDQGNSRLGMYSSQMLEPSSGPSKFTGGLESLGRTVTANHEFQNSLAPPSLGGFSKTADTTLSFDTKPKFSPNYLSVKSPAGGLVGLQFSKPKATGLDYNDLRSTGYSSSDNIELCVTPPEIELVHAVSDLSQYKKSPLTFKPVHQPVYPSITHQLNKSPEQHSTEPSPQVPAPLLQNPPSGPILAAPTLTFTNADGTRPSNNSRFKKKILFSKDNPENKGTCQTVSYEEQQSKSQPLISPPEPVLAKQSSRFSSKPPCKDDFYFGKKLGKGKFGTVFLAKHKQTGSVFAIKVIDKNMLQGEKLQNQFLRELKIQTFLSHPNIAKLYGFFADAENMYLILEMCCDGMLYSVIKEKRRLPEPEAKQIIRNFCNGTEFLHRQRIIHRDIKLQNIIMHEGVAKLCDFGWAVYNVDEYRTTVCGTPVYKTPQQIMGEKYDEKCDIWAIGILSYEVLVGKLPFKINCEKDLQKICNEQITFPEYVELTDQAKNFLLSILKKNAEERLDMEDIINHPFLKFEKDEHKFNIPEFL